MVNFWEERAEKARAEKEEKNSLTREKIKSIRRQEVKAFEHLILVDQDPESKEMKEWVNWTKKWDRARQLKPFICKQIREEVYEEQFDEMLRKSPKHATTV